MFAAAVKEHKARELQHKQHVGQTSSHARPSTTQRVSGG